MKEIKILLDEKDFTDLISGNIVNKEHTDIKILLKDIGYKRMLEIIEDVMWKSMR